MRREVFSQEAPMKTLCRVFLLIAAVLVFTAAQERSTVANQPKEPEIERWIQWAQNGRMWEIAPNGELLIPVAYDAEKETLYFTVHTMLDNYPTIEGYRPKDRVFPEPSIRLEWVGPDGNGHAYIAALEPRIAAMVRTTLENMRQKGGIFFAGSWGYCKEFGKPFANNECAEVFQKRLPFLFPRDSE